MCLARGPQRSDAGEARTRGPSVSSQALYHWATALTELNSQYFIYVMEVTNIRINSSKTYSLWNYIHCEIFATPKNIPILYICLKKRL